MDWTIQVVITVRVYTMFLADFSDSLFLSHTLTEFVDKYKQTKQSSTSAAPFET